MFVCPNLSVECLDSFCAVVVLQNYVRATVEKTIVISPVTAHVCFVQYHIINNSFVRIAYIIFFVLTGRQYSAHLLAL